MHTETEHEEPRSTRHLQGEFLAISERYLAVKQVMDCVAALVLSVLLAPLAFVSMVLVKLTSRGPAIYSQPRVGFNGRIYTIYKVRSMRHDCERASGARWAKKNDSRVTPIGGFLRKTHLDELPQLWNVIKGEMSLVGPRPERPVFVEQLETALPRYMERLRVRPGVTGLAQVQLPPDTDLESVRRKLVLDLRYVERLNFWLDARIVLVTGLGLVGVPHAALSRWLRLPALEDLAGDSDDSLPMDDSIDPSSSSSADSAEVGVHQMCLGSP